MKDSYTLISWYMTRLEQQSNKVAEQEKTIVKLVSYICELADDDCPEEYKHVVKSEALKILDD